MLHRSGDLGFRRRHLQLGCNSNRSAETKPSKLALAIIVINPNIANIGFPFRKRSNPRASVRTVMASDMMNIAKFICISNFQLEKVRVCCGSIVTIDTTEFQLLD